MSTVLNDRDAILQAATVRIVNPKNAWINLTASAPGFHLNAAGQVDLDVVTVTADLVGLDDDVTFSAVGATLSNAAARKVDVTYGGQTAIVTATVTSNGDEFKRSLIIPVLRDGASGTGTPGAPGARGAGHYYATGSTWSDVVAQAACPGSTPVLNDVVTISSSNYVMEKRWTGSAWIENGVVVNGRLIAPDSILASSIDARGLSIKDAAGNVILSAGAPLAEQTKINPNILERIDLWINEGAAWTYIDTNLSTDYARNGVHKVFPNSNFALFRSRTFLLNQNTDYTLSFKATNDGASGARDVICDLFPDDLPEGVVRVEPGINSYEVHWRTGTQTSLENCQVRIFTGAGASQLLIYDVKLERGKVKTAWSDNVLDARTVGNYVAPGAIGNTQIGGDLYSTNWVWNSVNDTAESGWLLQRSTSRLYARDVKLTGATMGGAFRGWSWPAAGQTGYYVGPEGALFGNKNNNRWLSLGADGTIESLNLNVDANGQVTVNAPILVNPKTSTQFSAGMSTMSLYNQVNTSTYKVYNKNATTANGVGPYRHRWSFQAEEGDISLSSDPLSETAVLKARGFNSVCSGYLVDEITDANGSRATASCRVFIQFGSGVAN